MTTSKPNLAPGAPTNCSLSFAIRMSQISSFVEQFPELLERSREFNESSELRSLPTLRYPGWPDLLRSVRWLWSPPAHDHGRGRDHSRDAT